MFLGCFSIFHLNIWWAFLWPHIVNSSWHLCGAPPSARNTLPSSFYSGLHQAWLCDLPWLHCSGAHVSVLGSCGGCADCLYLLSWCLTILGYLILFPHKFTSLWRGQAVSLCEEPRIGLVIMNVCWMNVQTQSDWPKMFESVTLSLLLLERIKRWWSTWSLCWGRPPGVHCVVSPWCEGWFIFICVHSLERGHSHRALNPCLVCQCFL